MRRKKREKKKMTTITVSLYIDETVVNVYIEEQENSDKTMKINKTGAISEVVKSRQKDKFSSAVMSVR